MFTAFCLQRQNQSFSAVECDIVGRDITVWLIVVPGHDYNIDLVCVVCTVKVPNPDVRWTWVCDQPFLTRLWDSERDSSWWKV